MSTLFRKIRLQDWRQFEDVSIDVHPRLTVITGSNGAGKSTILNLFSQHFGYSRPFLSTPRRTKKGIVYDLGYHYASYDEEVEEEDDFGHVSPTHHDEYVPRYLTPREVSPRRPAPSQGQFIEIGGISYDNGIDSALGYHEHQANAYAIQIQAQQQVPGVPITSHRTVAHYQQVQGLSLQVSEVSQFYQNYFSEITNRLNGGHAQFTPLYRMKETLIAMAAFGEGNSHLEANKKLLAAFNGFSKILRQVLPSEIGFQKLLVRLPDVVLKTKSGDFMLDSSSGGVTAIIEIAWQIYLYSLTNDSFSVTLDEPENHLHPSMQRSILSNLISAFPKAQFIVATHSPFIVSAVEDSNVYALKYTDIPLGPNGLPRHAKRRVRSIALDQRRKAGTASEILKEVLGVSVSIPSWAQNKLSDIVNKYQNHAVDKDTLKSLRHDLSEAGFSEFYPEALSQLVENQ